MSDPQAQAGRCREGLSVLAVEAIEAAGDLIAAVSHAELKSLARQEAVRAALATEQGRNLIRELNYAEQLFGERL